MVKYQFVDEEKPIEKKVEKPVSNLKYNTEKKSEGVKNKDLIKEELESIVFEIPKIKIIQIPMKNVELDKLEELPIDFLRDLFKDIFGYSSPRESGYGKMWISNKIRASFKTK